MKRLDKKQLKTKYDYYNKCFEGYTEEEKAKAIAFELAKDFIYQAQLDWEHHLNQNYSKFTGDVFRLRGDLREQAINETAEYLKN